MTQYPIRARGATELVESVEAAVVSGALQPGQRLPSVRSLAAHVGLSPGTVASGIAELRRRGVVVTEPRAQALSLRGVGVDERGMRSSELANALADAARAVVITPRGQNPTGAALDAERARELRAVLDRWPGVLVIEDDHLGPLAGSPLFT